jgi:hypothetical protein
MSQAELIKQALKLDARERAGMARRLLESLDELSAAELDALWAEEAEQRDRAVEEGRLASRPTDEVIAEIKATFG